MNRVRPPLTDSYPTRNAPPHAAHANSAGCYVTRTVSRTPQCGHATVSGDRDLLVIGEFQSIPILWAPEALALLR